MFLRIHTVDKAIAPLLKAQKDLTLVAKEREALIDENQDRILTLEEDIATAAYEVRRANRIAFALQAITDPDDTSDPDPDDISDPDPEIVT